MAKKDRDKKARHTESPLTEKTAKHSKNPDGYQHQFLAWHFQQMDNGGNWPCNFNCLEKIINKLHEFERLKWHEIARANSNHPMPVENLSDKAQERLSELIGETATLYQLNIGGKQRLWGLRQENIFQILWWDPQHTVYPTHLKNT